MEKILRNSGIAGTDYILFQTSNNPSIKCLHAQYGHYRGQLGNNSCRKKEDVDTTSGEMETNEINVVGKWVHDLLQDQFPDLIL